MAIIMASARASVVSRKYFHEKTPSPQPASPPRFALPGGRGAKLLLPPVYTREKGGDEGRGPRMRQRQNYIIYLWDTTLGNRLINSIHLVPLSRQLVQRRDRRTAQLLLPRSNMIFRGCVFGRYRVT